VNAAPTPKERAYMRAVEVADQLLARGLPLLGVSAPGEDGTLVAFLFDLSGDGVSEHMLVKRDPRTVQADEVEAHFRRFAS
jgi:hypothetical protein